MPLKLSCGIEGFCLRRSVNVPTFFLSTTFLTSNFASDNAWIGYWCFILMSRAQQREEVDRAYQIQSQAAIAGAARATAVGVGLAVMAHHLWPVFRRQTLAFKGFLVSGVTITGLIFGAESALIEHENNRRREENFIRREARLDLARRGLVGTETEIANWKAARESKKDI